jgi:hypothetical protein
MQKPRCHIALIDASPNTVDCRLGELCGCGARYCSVKSLVVASQAHKVVCENIQAGLLAFAKGRFRDEAVTYYDATIHIRTVLGADDASLAKLKARLAKTEELLKAERSKQQ